MIDPTPSHGPTSRTPPVLTTLVGALLFGALSLACGPHGQESLDLSGQAAAKVDPDLKRTASQLLATGHGDSLITVLVRVKGAGAETALARKHMRVESVIGDVATGRVAPSALAELAALDEVIMIEPARKLEIK